METTVKQRLIDFIKSQGISVNKFEKACGLSIGYVKNIRKSIQPEKLRCISLIFPNLNTGWLMTGEGEMLRENSAKISQSGTNNIAGSGNRISGGDQTALQMVLTEMAEQRKISAAQIAKAQEQIDRLIAIIEKHETDGK